MKSSGILNRLIIDQVAALGHTQYLCIADPGLPVPKGVDVIDVSITAGKPAFLDVLDPVLGELVVESVIIAEEMIEKNPALYKEMQKRFSADRIKAVPHENFKKLTEKANCIIRTGETKSYSNVILIGGVNF